MSKLYEYVLIAVGLILGFTVFMQILVRTERTVLWFFVACAAMTVVACLVGAIGGSISRLLRK